MNLSSTLLLAVLCLALVNCTPKSDDSNPAPAPVAAPESTQPSPETVVEPSTTEVAPAEPVQPEADHTKPVQPEAEKTEPVQPEADKTEPAQPAQPSVEVAPSPTVEPVVSAETTEPVQPSSPDAGALKDSEEAPHAAPESFTETVTTPDPLLSVDLLKFHRREMQLMTAKQVKEKNEETLDQLYQLPIPNPKPNSQGVQRVTAITPAMAREVLASIDEHPVVAGYASEKYDQPGTSIGYCFGRATYVHLALLKLGVAKESIRKIWLVGPMYSGNINWAFHVATVVRSTDGKWLVIDNFPGRVLEVRDWVKNFYPYNQKQGNLRVYITDPSKFTASLGKYSRIQLGLDLSADKDWYRNYFLDLMQWFQDHSMTEMGLPEDLRS